MSNGDGKRSWAKHSRKLMKSGRGRAAGGGEASRDSGDSSESEGTFWPSAPPKEAAGAGTAERDWRLGDRWELGTLGCWLFPTGCKCFKWTSWWRWTWGSTAPLFSAAEWAHEKGASDEAWFLREEPLEAGVGRGADKGWSLRATRGGGAGKVEVGMAPSSVDRGGESPRNTELEARSWLK